MVTDHDDHNLQLMLVPARKVRDMYLRDYMANGARRNRKVHCADVAFIRTTLQYEYVCVYIYIHTYMIL